MDMSLDDIITSTKGARRGGGRGRGRGGARTSGGRVGGGAGAAGRGRTTAGARRGAAGFTSRNTNFRGRTGNPDGVWSHDKFQDAGGARRSFGLRSGGAGAGSSKITISNLHFGVTDADITELFGELGAIKFASVHYDRSGRSMGKADILFDRRASAQQAIQQYNGVPLDGRPMEITWADAKPTATTASTSPRGGGMMNRTQGGRINRSSGGGGGAGGSSRGGFKSARGGAGTGRGRGRGGRGGRTQTKTPTAEELDAELDEYVSANQK